MPTWYRLRHSVRYGHMTPQHRSSVTRPQLPIILYRQNACNAFCRYQLRSSALYQHDYSTKHDNTSHLRTGINLQVCEVRSRRNGNSTEINFKQRSASKTKHDIRTRTGSFPPHTSRMLLTGTVLCDDATVSCYDSQRLWRMTWLWSTGVMIWAGKPKYSGGKKNLSQCHSAHHKSHIVWSGIEPWNTV